MAKTETDRKSPTKQASRTTVGSFSEDEKAAMREHARELEAAGRHGSKTNNAEAEREVLAKIAEMPEPDRTMGKRLHGIIKASAPSLSPKLWYGMPAYANADGQVVCFFQNAQKFKTRYATLGFSDKARLDDGQMWPTAFALKELTSAEETRIGAMVKKAAG